MIKLTQSLAIILQREGIKQAKILDESILLDHLVLGLLAVGVADLYKRWTSGDLNRSFSLLLRPFPGVTVVLTTPGT